MAMVFLFCVKKQGGTCRLPKPSTAQHSLAQWKSLGCCFGLSGWYGVCLFFCEQLFMRRGSSLARSLPGRLNQPGSSSVGFKQFPTRCLRNVETCLHSQVSGAPAFSPRGGSCGIWWERYWKEPCPVRLRFYDSLFNFVGPAVSLFLFWNMFWPTVWNEHCQTFSNIFKPSQDCSCIMSGCEPCLCPQASLLGSSLPVWRPDAWEPAVTSSIFRWQHFGSVENTKRYVSRQLLNDREWIVTRHFCNSLSFLLNIIAIVWYSAESVNCPLLNPSASSPLQSPQLRYLRLCWFFRPERLSCHAMCRLS